jgi:hypothetical protein
MGVTCASALGSISYQTSIHSPAAPQGPFSTKLSLFYPILPHFICPPMHPPLAVEHT